MQSTIAALLVVALAGTAPQEPSQREAATAGPRPLTSKEPSIPADWHEDPSKHRRARESQLAGDEYRAALKATGMADHLDRVRRGIALDGPTSWTLTGPVGGFGTWGDNGRVAGLQVLAGGTQNWVYAGACGGGLWRCNLATLGIWQSLGDGLPNPSARAFAVHPLNSQRILVGTGDWLRYRGGGMYKTDDGGGAWSAVSMSPTPTYFHRLLHTIDDPQIVLAASDNGLWRSINSGDSWTAVKTGNWSDLALHPTIATKMYAVQPGTGVFRSDDKGLTWIPLSSPNLPALASWGRSMLAICRDFPGTVAMSVEFQGDIHGVYRSLNGGTSWTDITSDLGTFGGAQANHAQALSFRPNDPQELFLGTDTIARSYWDSGTSQIRWKVGETAAGLQVGHADITQLHFSPLTGDDLLWISNDGGLFFHNFVGSATVGLNGSPGTGLAISQIDHFDADRNMEAIGLQDNGNLRTTNAGGSWARLATGDGGNVRIIDPEAWDMWFWVGMGWQPKRAIYGGTVESVPDPGAVAWFHYDPIAERMWAAGGQNVWSTGARSSPVIWTPEIAGGTHTSPTHAIRVLWGSQIESGTFFLSYGYGYDGDLTVAHKPGGVWDFNLTTGMAPTGWVHTVTPSSEWPGECWVGLTANSGQPKIYHTTDYGDNWDDVSGNLASVKSVRAVVPQPFNPLVLFAATDIGVFRSSDGGTSWSPFQDGLPVVGVRGLAFVVDDALTGTHKLRAATYGRGTWERDVVASPIVYVDRDFTGTENGTYEHPWNTVAEAVSAAPTGAIVAVRGNTYYEPQTVNKDLTLMTYKAHTVVR